MPGIRLPVCGIDLIEIAISSETDDLSGNIQIHMSPADPLSLRAAAGSRYILNPGNLIFCSLIPDFIPGPSGFSLARFRLFPSGSGIRRRSNSDITCSRCFAGCICSALFRIRIDPLIRLIRIRGQSL